MTTQMAKIYRRSDRDYVVVTYSRRGGPRGMWAIDGPVAQLAPGADPEELGEASLAALSRSRSGLPPVTPDSDPARPMLDQLGLADYAKFMRGTEAVELYSNSDPALVLEVTPQRNLGKREGYEPIVERRIQLADHSSAAVGQAIIEAFEQTS